MITHAGFGLLRRVYVACARVDAIHMPMSNAKRHRDREKKGLYVEIAPRVVDSVQAAAKERGINQWEIVELALAKGLPLLDTAAFELDLGLHKKTA